MNDDTRFDEIRSAAWRAAVVDAARADASRGGRRRRISLLVGAIVAALVVSGGGFAYALSATVLKPAPASTSSAAPIERETPSVTSSPVPSPPPTQDPAADAREQVHQACQLLTSALDSDGNIVSADAWAASLASGRQLADSAAGSDPAWASFASHLTALSETALPGPDATDAEKNSYFDAYLPVASDCTTIGVPLGTD